MKNCRKHPSIENYRHAKARKCKINSKLCLGYFRTRLEGSQHDFNSNKVNLPRSVIIKLRDKFKIRCMMKKDPVLFHIMLKQGITWFSLASNSQETV